eukprot:TRINITY_DN6610_c0_g1_i1.p1 TRINITY_DN6610_c0_g1~~TRINITY_DN6610_c0_g1_i1.p1  ORF type:complete len:490 (+),score=60.13 TRINITY_DN6610_c0_g1_i1:24-1493(+)
MNGMRLNQGLFVVVLIFGVLVGVDGSIIEAEHTLDGYTLLWTKSGIFSKENSPVHAMPGITENQDPYISYTLIAKNNDHSGSLYIMIVHHDVKKHFGVEYNGEWSYCCTQELLEADMCTQVDAPILKYPAGESGDNYITLKQFDYSSFGVDDIYMNETNYITRSGVYFFYIVNCGDHTFDIVGNIFIRNPYGYLPGELYGMLPTYVVISIAYIILLLIWGYKMARYHHNLMGLQTLVSLLLVVSFTQNIWWVVDLFEMNRTGFISLFFNIVGSILTAVKYTGVRLTVLLVAIGYSITKPVLINFTKGAITALTIIYLITASMYYYTLVAITEGVPGLDTLYNFTLALSSIANTIFFVWIAWAAYLTIQFLINNNQMVKYKMYRNLSMVLIACGIVSILFFIAQVIITSSDDIYFEAFSVWWAFDTYWEVIYFIVTAYIVRIWLPSNNNMRYAYDDLTDNSPIDDNSSVKDDNRMITISVSTTESDTSSY